MKPEDQLPSMAIGLVVFLFIIFIVVGAFQLGVMVGIAAGESRHSINLKIKPMSEIY